MFAVLLLKKDLDIEFLGQSQKLPLIAAVGMVGMIPVFESIEDAEKYADGRFEIKEITTGGKS